MRTLKYRMFSIVFLFVQYHEYWLISRSSAYVLARYKIGDSFFTLPLTEVQELVSADTERIDEDVTKLEEKLSACQDEMSHLKVALYGRFGRSINLET
jgi:hypothetical protein